MRRRHRSSCCPLPRRQQPRDLQDSLRDGLHKPARARRAASKRFKHAASKADEEEFGSADEDEDDEDDNTDARY
eukprot:895792-Pleurochrysis_carterae.AAC.1